MIDALKKNKMDNFKIIISYIFILPIFIFMIACGDEEKDNDSTHVETTEESETPETTNQKPTAYIIMPGDYSSGDTITLDGSQSSDPDDDSLTYSWEQTQGETILLIDTTNNLIRFTAPQVQQSTSFSFELTVNDGEFEDTTQVTFRVDPASTINPVPPPTPTPSDITPPEIISTSPREGQFNIAVNSLISATFNEELLQSSIDNTSFTLSANGTEVSGNVTYDSTNQRITFTPSHNLAESTTYTATLSANIQDLSGNNFQTESWAFATTAPLTACDSNNEPFIGNELHVGQGQNYSTIQAAINASQNGDTITIHAGTYFEANLKPKSGVSAAQHTVIRGAPGESTPVINAQGVFNQGPYTFIIEADHVTLKNLDVREGGGRNISIGDERPASDIVIDGLNIIDANPNSPTGSYDACCNASGIFVGYHGAVDGVIIKNTYFNNIYAAGVKIDSRSNHAQNVTIENNFFDRDHSGVHVKWAEEGVDRGIRLSNNYFFDIESNSVHLEQPYSIIQNNIIYYENTQVGVYIAENKTASNTLFSKNTLINANITMRNAQNVQVIDNIIYQGSIRDYSTGGNNNTSNNFTSDPLFVDLMNGDFSLQSGSLALNTASDGMDYGANLDVIGICGEMPNPFINK